MENIYASDLFKYSEWLDEQGLVKDEYSTGDKRTHEELVREFLSTQEEPEFNPHMPPGTTII